jgi:hypothetical protein
MQISVVWRVVTRDQLFGLTQFQIKMVFTCKFQLFGGWCLETPGVCVRVSVCVCVWLCVCVRVGGIRNL